MRSYIYIIIILISLIILFYIYKIIKEIILIKKGMSNIQATWDSATDKNIGKLHPAIRSDFSTFINRVDKELGIKLKLYYSYRTFNEQNELYSHGRTQEELNKVGLKNVVAKPNLPKITNAYGGLSYHNYGLAGDVAKVSGNSLIYDFDWSGVVKIAKELGFSWGGDFTSIVDKPHFQKTFNNSVRELYNKFMSGSLNEFGYVNIS
jgi:hypothetical protein